MWHEITTIHFAQMNSYRKKMKILWVKKKFLPRNTLKTRAYITAAGLVVEDGEKTLGHDNADLATS